MKFDVITIFPDIFNSYINESLINRAIDRKLINFQSHDLRQWSQDKRKSVDDRCFGGGLGMIIKVEPILRAVIELKKGYKKSKVITFTPRGKKFNQKIAYDFSKQDQLIMICGRYEGIDERVLTKISDENISIGDFILMGGEIPSMVVMESVSRLIPGVIGKENFISEKINLTGKKGFLEYPQYTRPEIFNLSSLIDDEFIKKYKEVKIKNKKIKDLSKLKWRVPKDLLKGNHKDIKNYREKTKKIIWE
jgi:tRNA (guanine37-N1)-methyltransferase